MAGGGHLRLVDGSGIPTEDLEHLVIGIDAGHGGKDSGAVHNSIIEKDYNAELANDLFWRMDPTNEYILIREEDETVGLRDRGKRARSVGCDLVISLHVNAHASPDVCGAMFFHWPGNTATEAACEAMARAWPEPLQRTRMVYEADASDPGQEWLQRPRNVLGAYACDALLVEVGFCSNPEDAELLKDEIMTDGIVAAIAAGVARYKYQKVLG